MKKRYTWAMVKKACDESRYIDGTMYLSYDDYGRKVLRDWNGWIQARTPAHCRFFVNMD